jgi:2,3-bisphosphoglycerate-independent phosphoglycerate mutase
MYRGWTLRGGGRLADVAPTVLAMMGLAQPREMTGQSLLVPAENAVASHVRATVS